MTPQSETSTILRVADLNERKPHQFDFPLTEQQCHAISQELDIISLKKARFKGSLSAKGKRDWQLNADLGATVQQACVVTLKPVTTRIDSPVSRRFVPEDQITQTDDEDSVEIEINPDDTLEPLEQEIDLLAIFIESLALELPIYPKAEGANLEVASFTEPGQAPMTDDDAKPFAGLASLRDKLQKGD